MRNNIRFRLQLLIKNILDITNHGALVEWDEDDKFYSIKLKDDTVIIIYNDEEDIQ